jgi:hypothetical protein
MSTTPNFNCIGFVIDTDQYAGNFERELCAHMTGHIGECEVGSEFVDSNIADKFSMIIASLPDDHGCYRPTSCYPSPNSHHNNSVIIYLHETPSQELIDIMKQRSETFQATKRSIGQSWDKDFTMNILGYRLVEFKLSQTEQFI